MSSLGEINLELYILVIEIRAGRNLKSADINGKSDPFCIITAGGQKYVTKVIKKNLNPDWNENTTFAFLQPVNSLKFEVFDWDKGELGKHDAIGDVSLDVSKLYYSPDKPFDGELKLQNVKKGNVVVKVTGRQILPTHLENRIRDLTKETNNRANSVNESNKKVEEATNKNDELKQDQETLNNVIKELKETQEMLEKDISQREENLNVLNGNKEEENKEIERLTKAIEERTTDLKKKNEELDSKKQALTEAKQKNEDLRTDIARIKDDINQVERELENLEN